MPEESTTPDLELLAQRFVDACNAPDFDAVMSLYAPAALVEGAFETYEGGAAVRGLYEDWVGAYEDFEFDVKETRGLGRDVAFVVFAWRGRLPGSSGWVQIRIAAVLTLADGLIRRQKNYTDIDAARAAAERLAEERRSVVEDSGSG